jgi:hypothetical protein
LTLIGQVAKRIFRKEVSVSDDEISGKSGTIALVGVTKEPQHEAPEFLGFARLTPTYV